MIVNSLNISKLPTKISGVYQIKFKGTSHSYVGSAVCLRRRLMDHREGLKRRDHGNQYMQRVFDKYGEDCMEFRVLKMCPKADILDVEQWWLDLGIHDLNITKSTNYNWKKESFASGDRHPQNKVPVELYPRIFEMFHEEKQTQRQIAKEFDIPASSVSMILLGQRTYSKELWERYGPPIKESKVDAGLVLELKSEGYLNREIAELMDVSITVVSHVVRGNRNYGGGNPNSYWGKDLKQVEEQVKQIKELRESGMIYKDIAEKLGVKECFVGNICRGNLGLLKKLNK